MNRSADALRRRRVRGVDLWVEIEEKHGAPVEEKQSVLGARLEHLLSTLPEAQRCGSRVAIPGRYDSGGDRCNSGCTVGDGEEQFASWVEVASREGNDALEGVHSWTLNGLISRKKTTSLRKS